MKRYLICICILGVTVVALTSQLYAQRGRGGGGFGGGGGGGGFRGGAGGGGFGGGGGYGGARPSGMSAPRPSGFTSPARTSAPPRPAQQPNYSNRAAGTGPNGGSWQAGRGSGSYTTKNGSTIDYRGAAVGGTGAGGISGGRYVGGVQVTTPGGQTINHVGRGGAATGPGGNTVAGRSGISNTYGTYGSGASASRSGFATGPNGSYAYRGGAAVGPNGAVAGRSAVAVTPHGTYYHSAVAVSGQGAYVRAGCVPYHNCFSTGWYAQYPGAWFAAGLTAGAVWNSASYSDVSSGGGYPEEPQSYDYGTNVVYQDDQVYADGEPVGTTAEYAQQATDIAEAGKTADPAKDKDGDWTPLGVFAMVRGEETTSDNIFQIAINKDGILRGNYYNALTDTATPIVGSVDKKSQRAAWTVGDQKSPVYEAGIVNLTTDNTTMMVHYSKEKSQQFTLFRIDKSDAAGANPDANADQAPTPEQPAADQK